MIDLARIQSNVGRNIRRFSYEAELGLRGTSYSSTVYQKKGSD